MERQKWKMKDHNRNKLGISFRGILDWKSSPQKNTVILFLSIHLTSPLDLSKERPVLKKILLLSFKRAGVSHLQNIKRQYHTVINNFVKIDIKKEVVIKFKSLWICYRFSSLFSPCSLEPTVYHFNHEFIATYSPVLSDFQQPPISLLLLLGC